MRFLTILGNTRFNPETMGPVKQHLNNAKETLKRLPDNKEWFCGGHRSAAIAAEMLKSGKIIALPTDTIYGLAGLAQNDASIARLYEIKKRDASRPLAICLANIEDIETWANINDLPKGLTYTLLPGPTTLVLKRKETLNPLLNPGVANVGVRIPRFDFVRSVVRMLNQPIALTSANISRTRSTLHPSEFEDLWPELDGIFYEKMGTAYLKNSWRVGSTVVDLTVKGEFEILRKGIGYLRTVRILRQFKLIERCREKKKKNSEETEDKETEPEISEKLEAHATV